jgi:hypothetical protein
MERPPVYVVPVMFYLSGLMGGSGFTVLIELEAARADVNGWKRAWIDNVAKLAMPKTAEEIMQRMEQLHSATKRLYEEHRKLTQEFEELKAELKALLERKDDSTLKK